MLFFSKYLLLGLLFINTAFGLDITTDRIDRGTISIGSQDINIRSGAFGLLSTMLEQTLIRM